MLSGQGNMRLNRHFRKGYRNLKFNSFQETNVTHSRPQVDFPFECREPGGNIIFQQMALSFGGVRRADKIRLICKFDDGINSNQMNLCFKNATENGTSSRKKKELFQLMELRFFIMHGVCVHAPCIYDKNRKKTRRQRVVVLWKIGKFSSTPLDLGYGFVSGIWRRNLDLCLINGGLTLLITLLLSETGLQAIVGSLLKDGALWNRCQTKSCTSFHFHKRCFPKMKSIKSRERFQFWQTFLSIPFEVFLYFLQGFEVENRRLPNISVIRKRNWYLLSLFSFFKNAVEIYRLCVSLSSRSTFLLGRWCEIPWTGEHKWQYDRLCASQRWLRLISLLHGSVSWLSPKPKTKDSSHNVSETRGYVPDWSTLWT